MSRFANVLKSNQLDEFVNANKVDKNLKPATEKQISALEKALNLHIGPQFKAYLLKYGALSYKHIEFLGISGSESSLSLVKTTQSLRKYGKVPADVVPIYKIHDEGLYAMVDGSDMVFEIDVYHYFKGMDQPKNTGMMFNDYIVKAFKEA